VKKSSRIFDECNRKPNISYLVLELKLIVCGQRIEFSLKEKYIIIF